MRELQKLESFKYALAVAETFDEIKLIKDASTSFAELARLQNISVEKQNEVGLFRLEITAKVGQWLDDHYPSNRKLYDDSGNCKEPEFMPVTKKDSSTSRLINKNPDLVQDAIIDIIEAEEIVTPNKVASIVRGKQAEILEVEVETIEQKSNIKTKSIMLYNLNGHEDPVIDNTMVIMRNLTEYFNKKDFKGFRRWAENYLEILINNYEE